MSFERIKTFWRGSNTEGHQESLFQQAQNMISLSLLKSQPNTSQFDQYINLMSAILKNRKVSSKSTLTTSTSLKPHLLRKCYEKVNGKYFQQQFNITDDFFTRNKKVNQDSQVKLHQDLDEVQICLFNQISSRFDEILSVLRTIQSLECIVNDNLFKIKNIRSHNIKLSKEASLKQIKVVNLIHKKKNREAALKYLTTLKTYYDFTRKNHQAIQTNHQAVYYSTIQTLKKQISIYKEFKATANIEDRIQEYEGALKKSFSENMNDLLFHYITEIVPYEKNYWSKFAHRVDMFQEENANDGNSTILDQSVLMEEEHIVTIKLSAEKEESILQNLKMGWNDGQYAVGGLKAKMDSFLKKSHQTFLQDYRNFCVQMCSRFQKTVQNPSLTNLLDIVTINFFSKVTIYFNDTQKNLIERLFSITHKCLQYLINQSGQDKSIDQKQKIAIIFDGLVNTEAFILKIVTDKMMEVLQLKRIEDTTDLMEFKTIIGILQCQQEFINKKLIPLTKFTIPQSSFLKERAENLLQKLNINAIIKIKDQKLFAYLSKTHKFVLESELKDNLENQIWQPIDIPTFYYDSLHYLFSGQSLNLRRNRHNKNNGSFNGSMMFDTSVLMDSVSHDPNLMHSKSSIGNFRIIRNQIIIEGKIYKVTQTLLLIIQILEDYLNLASSYPTLKKEVAMKMNELIRSYNSSSCQLIVHAGAVVLGKIKTKNITAKHLALSSLCLSFLLYLIECISKRADIYDVAKLTKDINEHINQTIKKLKTILSTKINQCLPEINLQNSPSKGTELIVSNTKILHDILTDYYQKTTLKQIFTKEAIKLYVQRVSTLTIINRLTAQALKDDITFYFNQLRFLNDLVPEFTAFRIQAQDIVRRAFQSL